MWKIIKKKKPK